MIINKDYSRALRAGYKIDKSLFREQQESGCISSICLLLAVFVSILAFILKAVT